MKKKVILVRTAFFLLSGLFLSLNVKAQTGDDGKTLKIKAIPYALKTVNEPLKVDVGGDCEVTISSKGKTNLFNSPDGNYNRQNAPMLLFRPDSNFIMSAKVTADLKEVYDVAALVIYQNNDLWAKLCFENSIDKEATVVSVVTRQFSDDCNSVNISDDFVYLAVAKKGKEFSFYCSSDKVNWKLVRHFRLECMEEDLMIGFAVHCSRGDMFTAKFSDISYSNEILENMRAYK